MRIHEKAYLAGIIDGEGSIGIYRSGPHRGCAANRLVLVLTVTSSCLALLNWCQGISEDTGSIILKRPENEKHQAIYEWKIRNQRAAKILAETISYMIIKRTQAWTGIAFAKTIGKIGQRLSLKTQQRRERLYQKMRFLNRKGKPQYKNAATPAAF